MGKWLSLAVLIMMLGCTFAWAEPFSVPPEATGLRWDTTFPYQRNALIDFSSDPAIWGADANNPDAFELYPGNGVVNGNFNGLHVINYDLEGTYDLTLYESDWFDVEVFSGAGPTWYANDPFGSGRTGVYGVYQASEPTSWRMTWHLDNLPDPRDYKRVWQEYDMWFGGGIATGTFSVVLPNTTTTLIGDILFNQWDSWNLWTESSPNAVAEDLRIELVMGQGSSFLLDDWHVATECTPEPVSALLLLAGAPVVMAAKRRRREAP